jgi:hypothetical protein
MACGNPIRLWGIALASWFGRRSHFLLRHGGRQMGRAEQTRTVQVALNDGNHYYVELTRAG